LPHRPAQRLPAACAREFPAAVAALWLEEPEARMKETPEQIFERGGRDNPRFWSRFSFPPVLADATVMDVGCAHGRLCVDMALAGVRKVVGIDIDADAIAFANENLRRNYPQLVGPVEFTCADLRTYDGSDFDYIVSKESGEHFLDFAGMLAEMGKRLKPGGRIYMGFGPLWNSPYGDHKMYKLVLPWAHLVVPERIIARRVSKLWRKPIESISATGLNRLSLADYRRIFHESGLKVVSLAANCSTHPLVRICSVLRKLPFLEEYFTLGIFCTLEKPREA